MTTAGLELTNFIDPSLTWKTVSKGRTTSRRSRRADSKTSKMNQDQEKKTAKRFNETHSTESDKSDGLVRGRGLTGNLEHIPIKKRRFLLRSPSPPPQPPNDLDHETSQYSLGQGTLSNGNTRPQVMPALSNARVFGKSASDNNIEGTVHCLNGAPAFGEDFSGIAILAAAACSGGLDSCFGDVGESKIGGMLRREDSESSACATNMKENVAILNSASFHAKDIRQLKGEGCVGDLPVDNSRSVCLTKNVENGGRSQISELAKTEPNEVASVLDRKGSIECHRSPESVREDVPLVEESSSDLPSDCGAHKTLESSGASRDFRLHWDLNTVMDEWDHPLDDAVVDPGMQSFEVASKQGVNPLNTNNEEASEPPEESVAIDSDSLPGCSDSTGLFSAFNKPGPSLEVSLHLVRNHSKGDSFSVCSHAVEYTINGVIESEKEREVDAGVDNSLSLGFSGKAQNSTTSESQPAVLIAQPHMCETDLSQVKTSGVDNSLSLGFNGKARNLTTSECQPAMLIAQPHMFETGLSQVKPSSYEVRDSDSGYLEDFKEKKALDVYGNNGAAMESQSVPEEFLAGVKCEIAVDASITGDVSCKVADIKSKYLESVEPMKSADGNGSKLAQTDIQSAESHPSVSKIAKVGLKYSVGSHCTSKLQDMVAPSATAVNYHELDAVASTDFKDRTPDTSTRDDLVGVEFCVPEAVMEEDSTLDPLKQSGHNAPENPLDGVCNSLVSNKESSQVTEDVTNVPDTVGGYDSHLEDGELRESVGHCWENNEAEDIETERVDYDSDDREGVFFGDATDFVHLSAEVLAGECEKQSCRSDNFSSADEKAYPDKSLEENCPVRRQGSSSTACAREAECTKHESPILNACTLVQLKGENNSDRVEVDFNDRRESDIEADSLGKECDSDAQRNAKGASSSGRELHVLDRSVNYLRKSRSSNFDGTCPDGGSGESLARRQSTLQMDRFGGRSCDVELKSVVEDGEGAVRVSDDTSPRARQPCFIPTSRSGYHLTRRGSPGGRENSYGSGMMKFRDFSPDTNSRSRFDKFSNGMYRGQRDGYRRPGMYDGGKSGGPMVNNFGKGERSFSPFNNRMDPYFHRNYRKSRSRSRTRSPDFRSEARMGRARVPYQSTGYTADHTRDRRSPVRMFNQRQRFDNMGSAGRLRSDDGPRPMMRNMRFHDTSTSGRDHDYVESDDYRRKPVFLRNRRSRSRSRSCSPDLRSDARMGAKRPPYQGSGDHVRGRRSPVRGFRPGQRYDNGGSPGRLRSDDGMRPVIRPARFGNTVQPGRGQEFSNGGDDYRRKPRNIFERIHPRNYDANVDGRRFQYGEQDDLGHQNFRRNDNYTRGGDGRPAEGFRRDDRGSGRYNNERMFYPGPKQFGGMRDYADDSMPRGVRP